MSVNHFRTEIKLKGYRVKRYKVIAYVQRYLHTIYSLSDSYSAYYFESLLVQVGPFASLNLIQTYK